jgi:hypothetical protein
MLGERERERERLLSQIVNTNLINWPLYWLLIVLNPNRRSEGGNNMGCERDREREKLREKRVER